MATNPTNMNEDEFTSYLAKHGIYDYKKRGNEISFSCPFGGCDDDHRGNEEFHCSFNCDKCTYYCFKCGAKGNFIELLKHFGDYEEYNAEQKEKLISNRGKKKPSLELEVQHIHKNTRESVREYFNGRGINNDSIDRFMLGVGTLGGHHGFIIPVLDRDGKIAYVKIRRTPEDELTETIAETMNQRNPISKYTVYPAGSKLVLVGEDQLVNSTSSDVLICEGELDRIIAIQEGVKMPVICGGGGAQTFKDEWIDALKNMRNIYICMDRDKSGEEGFKKLAKKITEHIPTASVYKIWLPFDHGTHCDLTDYFVQKCGTTEELFSRCAEYYCGAKPIDPTIFEEMTVEDVASVLDSTIKYDLVSKVITFLAMLLTYTDSEQLNIMFNASSSTGKSYICHEVSKYFPQQDVNIYGKTTPTAFYYSKKLRKIDPETGEPFIDLARRIMIHVEQPDTKLQVNLRAVLSHEKKRVPFAITNKEKGGRNAAEEGYILGYPTAIFCSANTEIDEQEQTRSIILSPDSSRKKVLAGIDAYIDKNCHRDAFDVKLQDDKGRKSLMERILYIKSLEVDTIDVGDSEYLKQCFIDTLDNNIPPSAMRGIHKFTALAKGMALLNAPFRIVEGKIVVTHKDVDEAMKLWSVICGSMAYSLSPQLYDIYSNIIVPAWVKKNKGNKQPKGISIKEFRQEYKKKNGSYPNMESVRKEWLRTLDDSEYISYDYDKGGDKRQKLISPLVFSNETSDDDSDSEA